MRIEFRGYIVLTEMEPLEIYPIKDFNNEEVMKTLSYVREGGWINIRGLGLLEVDSVEVLKSHPSIDHEIRSIYVYSVPVLMESTVDN